MTDETSGSIPITEVRNCRYIDPRGSIDMEINHPEFGWINYTWVEDDDCDMIDNAALLTLAQAQGITPLDQQEYDEKIGRWQRMRRMDELTHVVDPIVTNPLRWASMTEAKQQEWTAYRQALLDVPDQEGFPHDVVWPTPPE